MGYVGLCPVAAKVGDEIYRIAGDMCRTSSAKCREQEESVRLWGRHMSRKSDLANSLRAQVRMGR